MICSSKEYNKTEYKLRSRDFKNYKQPGPDFLVLVSERADITYLEEILGKNELKSRREEGIDQESFKAEL